MERSKGPGRSLPTEDKRKPTGQAVVKHDGGRLPLTDVGNSSRDSHATIPRFKTTNNQAKLSDMERMADQRTKHAEKRYGGARNDRRVNTDPRTRTHGKQFFVKGRVFNTSSEDGSALPSQTFLVIREARESPDDNGTHCTCLSVSPLRKDLDLSECGVLHASSTSPPTINGVKFKPLQVMVSRDAKFDTPMLVNYIKMFNVDINSEVNDVGKLRAESMQDSMDNFKESLFNSPMDRDGRYAKQGRRKGKGEEGSNKPPRGYKDQGKPYSKGTIAPNTRSAATAASGSGTVPNGTGTEATSKRPKLRNLEVPQHTKRQKPKGSSSYDSDGWEDGSNSPTRTRGAENKKLQDARNHQRKQALPPVDQVRGTKERHGREMPARRAEEEVLKGPSNADMARSRGDERTGRPAITSPPHSPTKRNLNHRRGGDGVHKVSSSGVPGSIPISFGDSSDRGRQRDRNYPGAPRDMVPSRRDDALRKNDYLRKDDGQPANSGSRPQSPDRAFNDGKQGYGSQREDNSPIDGRRGHEGKGPPPDARRGLPPPTGQRDIPPDGTSRHGVPSDGNRGNSGNNRNEHLIPGNGNIGRPSDRARPDPRAMATETSLPNKARPDELSGRHGKGHPTTGSGPPGQAPNHRSQMSNNPPPSRQHGREPPQSNADDRQPMRSPENNATYRSEPRRSNDQRSVSPRRLAQPASSSRPSGGSTGVSSRSPPQPPSRDRGPPTNRGPPPSSRGPPDRDASPGRNLPPLNTPGSRLSGGDYSPAGNSPPMREGSPVGGAPGPSSAMSGGSPHGSPTSLSPGNSMAGGSPGRSPGESPNGSPGRPPDSPNGSETGSLVDSSIDSTASGSPLNSTQGQSPIGDSSYRSPMGSERPSPTMTGRSRSLSPPPRGRSQSRGFSPDPGSSRSSSPGGRPEQDRGGVRRRDPKGKSGAPIDDEQPRPQGVDNEESNLGDDGCCGNGFFAWCKSVLDWFNGVGQEEWIQMDDQKDKGKSRQNSQSSQVPDNEDSRSVASGSDTGSPSSTKDPFGDGQDDDGSTAVDSDEEKSGDDQDGDSDDENGYDQEDSDDAPSDSDVESNDGTEDEIESENSSAASSRRSSTAVASELDHQDSVRQSADNHAGIPPENNYPANNQHLQTPQDSYSYAPNDDRSYMGQHNYPAQNGYITNPNNIPPQELESAYPTTHSAKSTAKSFPKIPENAAELATDNSEPACPPPYVHIPSTPQQLSRPRSTRFELACERDPVELEVPSIATTTTRGKSELFLPPSLTPGVATAPNGFPPFSAIASARTPPGFQKHPIPRNSWTPPQKLFSPYQPREPSHDQSHTNISSQTPQVTFGSSQPQPGLREDMNYAPQVPPPVYPAAPRYDARGNKFQEQSSREAAALNLSRMLGSSNMLTFTPPPFVPARSELRPPSFSSPLYSFRNVGRGNSSRGQIARGQNPRLGNRNSRGRVNVSMSRDVDGGHGFEDESESEPDSDSGSDGEYELDHHQRNMNGENGDSDDESDLDSGFGTYDDDLVGRQDDFQMSHHGATAASSGLNSLPGGVDISASTHTPAPAPAAVREGFNSNNNPPISYMGYNYLPHDQQYRQLQNPGFLPLSSPSIYNPYPHQRQNEMSDKAGIQRVSEHKRDGKRNEMWHNLRGGYTEYSAPRDLRHGAEMVKGLRRDGGENIPKGDIPKKDEEVRKDTWGKQKGKEKEKRRKIEKVGGNLKSPVDSSPLVNSFAGGNEDLVISRGLGGEEEEYEYEHGREHMSGGYDSESESEEEDEGEEEDEEEESESELEESDVEEEVEGERDGEGEDGNHNLGVDYDEGMHGEGMHGEGMHNEGESLASVGVDVGLGEEKRVGRRGKSDDEEKRKGKGRERVSGGKGDGRGERGDRGEKGYRRRNGGRERRQKEGDGVDVSGKIKKTWEFLKKLDYHEK
ncbi:hypothetical protein EAF04_008821 [Stromatinia cepivora]|nr:hypothetical protein EAF04_008821 [Stromatinia cepivora]